MEIQDQDGNALPGFALKDCMELIGNEIERAVTWQEGTDLSSLEGKTVRLLLEMKDADLYSLRFKGGE